jgi:hypothetical protein
VQKVIGKIDGGFHGSNTYRSVGAMSTGGLIRRLAPRRSS